MQLAPKDYGERQNNFQLTIRGALLDFHKKDSCLTTGRPLVLDLCLSHETVKAH